MHASKQLELEHNDPHMAPGIKMCRFAQLNHASNLMQDLPSNPEIPDLVSFTFSASTCRQGSAGWWW